MTYSIMARLKILPLICIFSACCSCVVTPRSVEHTDEKCGRLSKRYVLDVHEIESFPVHCINLHCEAEAMLLIGVSVVSAIVSGSVMVLGNTVHWLEEQKTCPNQDYSRDPTAKTDQLLIGKAGKGDKADKQSAPSSYKSSILTPATAATSSAAP